MPSPSISGNVKLMLLGKRENKKNWRPRWLGLSALVIISLSLFISFFASQHDSPSLLLAPQYSHLQKNPGHPVRIKIPKIEIDAVVEYVGLTEEGSMDIPHDVFNAGWFSLGPRPGERGNAVIAGHVNDVYGGDAVFANLSMLQPGDQFSIEDDLGSSILFVVRESRLYDPGYAEDVFSGSGGFFLNLITCDGVWDTEKKSYSQRLVVFAEALP